MWRVTSLQRRHPCRQSHGYTDPPHKPAPSYSCMGTRFDQSVAPGCPATSGTNMHIDLCIDTCMDIHYASKAHTLRKLWLRRFPTSTGFSIHVPTHMPTHMPVPLRRAPTRQCSVRRLAPAASVCRSKKKRWAKRAARCADVRMGGGRCLSLQRVLLNEGRLQCLF